MVIHPTSAQIGMETFLFFTQAAYDMLQRCAVEIPEPVGLQLYLCNIRQIPAGVCFQHEKKWQIVFESGGSFG